jgi:hypothetical protein
VNFGGNIAVENAQGAEYHIVTAEHGARIPRSCPPRSGHRVLVSRSGSLEADHSETEKRVAWPWSRHPFLRVPREMHLDGPKAVTPPRGPRHLSTLSYE